MASPSAEAIDESTLSFLLAENLARVKEEEKGKQAELASKERVVASVVERFMQSFDRSRQLTDVEHRAVAWFVATSAVNLREKRKKKKKKRRKRRLPRGVRIPRCGQGSRSRSQCPFLQSTGLRCSASWPVCTRRTSPPSSSFMAVAYAMLVWLVPMHLALCFFLTSLGPGCSASWPTWTRRTVVFVLVVYRCSGMCKVGFPGDFALRAVFSSCRQAQILGILAGMDQMDSFVARFWRTWCSWFRLQKTVDFPQLQPTKVVDISFEVHRPSPMVVLTIGTPQMRVDTVVDALFLLSLTGPSCATTCRRLLCRHAEAVFPPVYCGP